MGIISPAPNVLGAISLTAAVELFCLIHLVVCIVFIILPSSVDSVVIAGVVISPLAQCLTGAFFLLGIPMIILGGVSAVYRMESYMAFYLGYLGLTFMVAVVWFATLLTFGSTCHTLQPTSNDAKQAYFVCGLSNGMIVFWMLLSLAFVGGGLYLVWSMKAYIRARTETELFRYQEPWEAVAALADDVAAEEARQRIALGQVGPWNPTMSPPMDQPMPPMNVPMGNMGSMAPSMGQAKGFRGPGPNPYMVY